MQEVLRRSVTLVLGGARSGKSRRALEIASRAQAVVFVATAQACDEEMRAKIERHRLERPSHWQTVEEPLDLAGVILRWGADCDLIVLDCLTLFAANLLEAHAHDAKAIHNRIAEICGAVRVARCSLVLVSNEVGCGVVPAYPVGRRFQELLGEINQRMAVEADNVTLMVAGLPLAIKGNIEGVP